MRFRFVFAVLAILLLFQKSVLAQNDSLVVDFNQGSESSFNQWSFKSIEINSKYVFTIEDPLLGKELGVLQNGEISVLKDINEGPGDSQPYSFIKFNGKVYFSAEDQGQTGLWETDGTTIGTKLVYSTGTSRPGSFRTSNSGEMFFLVGEDLFKYNGTSFNMITSGVSYASNGSRSGNGLCAYEDGIAFVKKIYHKLQLCITHSSGFDVVGEIDVPNDYFGPYGLNEIEDGLVFALERVTYDDINGTYFYNRNTGSLTRKTVLGSFNEPGRLNKFGPKEVIGTFDAGTVIISGSEDIKLVAPTGDKPYSGENMLFAYSNGNVFFSGGRTSSLDNTIYYLSDGTVGGTTSLFETRGNFYSNIITVESDVFVALEVSSIYDPSIYRINLISGEYCQIWESDLNSEPILIGVQDDRLYYLRDINGLGWEMYSTTLDPLPKDLDDDGFTDDVDCDDNDDKINPDAFEICNDGIDNDCDGETDEGCPLPPHIDVMIEGDLEVETNELTVTSGQNITALFESNGSLYIGDANGFIHYEQGDTWVTVDVDTNNDSAVDDIALNDNGIIVSTISAGAYIINGGASSNISTGNEYFVTNNLGAVAANGTRVNVVQQGDGLFLRTAYWDFHLSVDNFLISNNVNDVEFSTAGWMLVGSDVDLSFITSSNKITSDFLSESIYDVYMDRFDSYSAYVGTGNGVYKVLYDGWNKSTEQLFSDRKCTNVILRNRNELWVIEEGVGLYVRNSLDELFFNSSEFDLPSKFKEWVLHDGKIKGITGNDNKLVVLDLIPDMDKDNDGFEEPEDCDDTNPLINPDAEEIPHDGIDNNCNGETDENAVAATCDNICIGFPHPTLGGYVFYLNGLGGGLMVHDTDLLNPKFDNLSMFQWAEPEHLRTEVGQEFFSFSNWSATSTHTDQKIIDAYGASGNYASMAIREQLGAEWRLPTATEAYYMDLNLNKASLGNFTRGHYWTSSEVAYTAADIASPNVVAIDMTNGTLTKDMAKNQALKVRAVRAF